jgi:hypothetical protein
MLLFQEWVSTMSQQLPLMSQGPGTSSTMFSGEPLPEPLAAPPPHHQSSSSFPGLPSAAALGGGGPSFVSSSGPSFRSGSGMSLAGSGLMSGGSFPGGGAQGARLGSFTAGMRRGRVGEGYEGLRGQGQGGWGAGLKGN